MDAYKFLVTDLLDKVAAPDESVDVIGALAFSLLARDAGAFLRHQAKQTGALDPAAQRLFLETAGADSRIHAYQHEAEEILRAFAELVLSEAADSIRREASDQVSAQKMNEYFQRLLAAVQGIQMTQNFNTNIFGSVGNLAQGSTGVNQTAAVNVATNDWPALVSALKQNGLSDAQLADLRAALDADKQQGATGMGPTVTAWLGQLVALAASGVGSVATNAVGGAIAPLIAKFLGIGS